jgi:hypothetical protein
VLSKLAPVAEQPRGLMMVMVSHGALTKLRKRVERGLAVMVVFLSQFGPV